MDALKRTIFLVLVLTSVACYKFKKYDPCEHISGKFCEFDCCYDYLTCRENDENLVYLGADSIMRYKNAYGGFGINFAYRLYNLQFPTISKYWKPSEYIYRQWVRDSNPVTWSPGSASGCFLDDPRKGNLVASLLYGDQTILVCGMNIIVFDSPFNRVQETIPRNGGDCRNKYPLLCTEENGQSQLIDAFTLVHENGTEFMVAYYGESQIDNPGLYDREYTIAPTIAGIHTHSEKVSGQLSAIDIYEIDGKVAKGLIALNDGRVCPFEHTIGDTNFDFERHGFIEDGCRALQTYLACPQAWCVDTLIDSSFTVNQMQNKEEVYFILYNNMWIVDAKPLPMDVPMHGKHRVWFAEYSKADPNKVVLHIRKETSAAFTSEDTNGNEIVFSSLPSNENPNWKAVSVKEHPNARAHDIGLIGGIKNPDAAWFDKSLKILYLFEGNKYYTFKNVEDIYSANAWKETGRGSTADLGLKDFDGNADDGIDAVVSMSGSNYFFNQRFRFYQIDDGQTKTNGPSRLAQKDFFRLLSQCYYNDFPAYQDVLDRNKEKVPVQLFVVNKSGEYPTLSLEASKSSPAPYIIAILFLGGVVATVGLVLLFMMGNRKVVFQTTVVKRYEQVQPKSRTASNRLKQKSTLKPLKSKSVFNPLKSENVSNSQKSKSVLKPLNSKSAVKSVTSKSPK